MSYEELIMEIEIRFVDRVTTQSRLEKSVTTAPLDVGMEVTSDRDGSREEGAHRRSDASVARQCSKKQAEAGGTKGKVWAGDTPAVKVARSQNVEEKDSWGDEQRQGRWQGETERRLGRCRNVLALHESGKLCSNVRNGKVEQDLVCSWRRKTTSKTAMRGTDGDLHASRFVEENDVSRSDLQKEQNEITEHWCGRERETNLSPETPFEGKDTRMKATSCEGLRGCIPRRERRDTFHPHR